MLAAAVDLEESGNNQYQNDHMGKIFREGLSFSGFERDKLYLNKGGERFVDISGLSGLDAISDGRGAAYADFDNDGDYDLFLTSLQGQVHHLFRNNIGQDKGFIRIELVGHESGKDAYGTEVRLKTSQGILTKIKAGGSGFVSQSDPRLLFGMGADERAEWLEIKWPSGATQRFDDLAANSSLRAVEGQPQLHYLSERHFTLPDPVDASFLQTLNHRPGDLFPAVSMVDLQGAPTDFQTYRQPERAYLVNFWATYCVPCRREMPELERLAAELEPAGLHIVGISLDMDKNKRKIPTFLKRMGISYPVFTSDESVFEQLFASEQFAIPLSFLIDRQGRITEVFSGWSEDSEARVRNLVR